MVGSFWRTVSFDDVVYVPGTEARGFEVYLQGEDCEDGSSRNSPFHLKHRLLVPWAGVGW
jgi:hypothetical protein